MKDKRLWKKCVLFNLSGFFRGNECCWCARFSLHKCATNLGKDWNIELEYAESQRCEPVFKWKLLKRKFFSLGNFPFWYWWCIYWKFICWKFMFELDFSSISKITISRSSSKCREAQRLFWTGYHVVFYYNTL